MLLTIAIPTYAREAKLTALLEQLLPACPPIGVEILVLDNASPVDVETYARSKIPKIPAFVRFHRNRANVGLAANICRCYELASAKWVWTMGDDDTLPSSGVVDVVTQILTAEEAADHADAIQFSTSLYQYQSKTTIRSLHEFWDIHTHPLAFSNAVFLSSCIIKTQVFLDHLRTAYQFGFSIAPHFAVKLASIRDGRKMTIHPHVVMHHHAPEAGNGWDWTTLAAGLPILAEIPDDDVTITKLGIPLAQIIPGIRLRQGIAMIFLDRRRCPGFWHAFFSRLVPLLRGKYRINAMLLRFLAGLTSRIPFILRGGALLFGAMGKTKSRSSIGLERL